MWENSLQTDSVGQHLHPMHKGFPSKESFEAMTPFIHSAEAMKYKLNQQA